MSVWFSPSSETTMFTGRFGGLLFSRGKFSFVSERKTTSIILNLSWLVRWVRIHNLYAVTILKKAIINWSQKRPWTEVASPVQLVRPWPDHFSVGLCMVSFPDCIGTHVLLNGIVLVHIASWGYIIKTAHMGIPHRLSHTRLHKWIFNP